MKGAPSKLRDVEMEESYAYAYAQYKSGNWRRAIETFQALCTKRPLESRFWFGLGASLQEAGSFKDALQAWAMTALLKEGDPYPHFHAAECYLSLKEEREAAKALFEAEERTAQDHRLREKIALIQQQWKM